MWTSRDEATRYAPAITGLPSNAFPISMLPDGTYISHTDTGALYLSTDAQHWTTIRIW